jgi:hypothetical protein
MISCREKIIILTVLSTTIPIYQTQKLKGIYTALLSSRYWGLFPWRVKWQGHEADHSPPYSAEVKNGRAIPPLPHVYMA